MSRWAGLLLHGAGGHDDFEWQGLWLHIADDDALVDLVRTLGAELHSCSWWPSWKGASFSRVAVDLPAGRLGCALESAVHAPAVLVFDGVGASPQQMAALVAQLAAVRQQLHYDSCVVVTSRTAPPAGNDAWQQIKDRFLVPFDTAAMPPEQLGMFLDAALILPSAWPPDKALAVWRAWHGQRAADGWWADLQSRRLVATNSYIGLLFGAVDIGGAIHVPEHSKLFARIITLAPTSPVAGSRAWADANGQLLGAQPGCPVLSLRFCRCRGSEAAAAQAQDQLQAQLRALDLSALRILIVDGGARVPEGVLQPSASALCVIVESSLFDPSLKPVKIGVNAWLASARGLVMLVARGQDVERLDEASLKQLSALRVLDLVGCRALRQLPESLGQLSALRVLNLVGCSRLSQLPESLGQLSALQELNLVDCRQLSQLPRSLRQLKQLNYLSLTGCPALAAKPCCEVCNSAKECAACIQGLLRAQDRRQTVLKLANQQDTMLTTLERMSWLVILLATATFMAFMSPPGGFSDRKQVLAGNATMPISCSAAAGNGTSVLPSARAECALLLFFVFDCLAFSLSLGCIMVIVVLSMPRLRRVDDAEEAGRFWWLLLAAWSLLYLAVLFGYLSFVASAVAMFERWQLLTAPLAVGAVLLALGAVLVVARFAHISPGGEALLRGWCAVSGYSVLCRWSRATRYAVYVALEEWAWKLGHARSSWIRRRYRRWLDRNRHLVAFKWLLPQCQCAHCRHSTGRCLFERSDIKLEPEDVEMGRREAVERLTAALQQHGTGGQAAAAAAAAAAGAPLLGGDRN